MCKCVFQKAGFEEDRIVECHGSIHYLQCVNTDVSSEIWPVPEGTAFDVNDDLRLTNAMPTGPSGKNHPARPNILMFGDWGWQGDRTDEQKHRFSTFQKDSLRKGPFVVIEIGAGTVLSLDLTALCYTIFFMSFMRNILAYGINDRSLK